MVNKVPTEERITLGLKKSTVSSQTITASTFAPSPVLKTAPKFPGFSTASNTTINGLSGNFNVDKSDDFVL